MKHLRRHANEPGFVLTCIVCDRTYKSVRYWLEHSKRHETQPLPNVPLNEERPGLCSPSVAAHSDENDAVGTADTDETVHAGPEVTPSTSVEAGFCNSQEQIALFINKLRGDHNLTESACNEVVSFIRSSCMQAIKEREENPSIPICSLPLISACASLHNYRAVKKFIEAKFKVVKPTTVLLGKNQNGSKLTFQYVSLVGQCEQLISHPVVQASLLSDLSEEDIVGGGVYEDVRSGLNHRSRRSHLPLFVFYDDFEILNAVGNKAGKQKLGGIYFTIGSVPFRSRKRHIFLLSLCRSSYFKRYREKILAPLVRDAKFLEQVGLPMGMNAQGEEVRVKISIEVLIGDNLGCHTIGGFTENFSTAQKICRFCYCTPDSIQIVSSADDCALRTSSLYEAELSKVRDAEFEPSLCSKLGIKVECELNALSSFHVVTSMPPDYAHDILEGSARVVISAVLTELVTTRIVSFDTINESLMSFPYSSAEENRPETLKWWKGKVLCKQTAKECWTLLRLLPLAVGGHVQEENKAWEILLAYLTIVRMIISPSFTESELVLLQRSIESWLHEFKMRYGDIRITPKMHYLLHYSDQIRKHGALISVSTLRYEHKHQQLKKLLETTKNYKNPAYTLAWRHQLWIAPKVGSNDFFTYKSSIDVCSPALVNGVPDHATESCDVGLRGVVKGTKYREGNVLCFKAPNASLTQMARVRALLKDKTTGAMTFLCQSMDVLGYNQHLGAFEVQSRSESITVPHACLCDSHPLTLYLGRYVVEQRLIRDLHPEL